MALNTVLQTVCIHEKSDVQKLDFQNVAARQAD